MTIIEFTNQMQRLEKEFGSKAFGGERLDRIKNFVMDLNAYSFRRIVDHMLDNFRQAPLPKDFREAAIAEKRTDPREVPDIMQPNFKGDGGLQRVLARDYEGCKTLAEAVELERFRLRLRQAEDEYEKLTNERRPS